MSRSICGTCYCVIDDDTGECGCIYPDTASPQPAAQPEQPEPGVLTEAQALAIADKHGTRWAAPDEEGISFEKSAFFDFLSEVLSTRKRTAEQVARIMEAVEYFASFPANRAYAEARGAARAEVERLLRGEA